MNEVLNNIFATKEKEAMHTKWIRLNYITTLSLV